MPAASVRKKPFAIPLLALLGLSLSLWAAACEGGREAERPKGIQVALAKVEETELPIETTVPAHLAAKETVEVRARVSGYVSERSFEEGSFVTKGQLLYKLDDRDLKAAVEAAQAETDKAEAAWKNDDITKGRMVKLAASGAVSEQQKDNAVAQAEGSLAAFEAAKADLQKARVNLGYAAIAAPVDGYIDRSQVEVGSNVDAGNATLMTTIYNIDPIRAEFSITDREYDDYMKIIDELGHPALVFKLAIGDSQNDYPHDGALEMADPVVNDKTGTLGIRAVFPNPGHVLRPGMYGNVTIIAGREKDLLIPVVAITDQQGAKVVYQVDEKGLLKGTVVTLGQVIGDKQVVLKGLKAGDSVVVKGLVNARPGLPAIVENAPAAPPAPSGQALPAENSAR